MYGGEPCPLGSAAENGIVHVEAKYTCVVF